MLQKFLPLLFFVCLFVFLLVGFGLIYVFVRSKLSLKKTDRLEIAFITSLTILLKRVKNLVFFEQVKRN